MSPIEKRFLGRGDVCLIDNSNPQLTSEECQVIANFRAMDRCAKQMIVDLAAQYSYTLPAGRVQLTIVPR